jgi:D-3-phosphoglycerate dehydrogenase
MLSRLRHQQRNEKPNNRVLLTDHPWPGATVEQEILEAAGLELVIGPPTAGSAAEIERLVQETDPAAILTCWAPISATAISAPSNLRIVTRLGTGLDNVAVEQATARGAWVTNVPDYCTEEVADHAVALVLAHFRRVPHLHRAVRERGWHSPDVSLRRISSLCVGLIGFGRIGEATARRFRGFGCRILACSRSGRELAGLAKAASLPVLLAEADVIILQLPLTPDTANMVDIEFLKSCRRRPLLVNVGRGGLVDNDALEQALDAGWIAAAALDVIAGEPDPPAALLRHDNIVVTPHVAYLSQESLGELRRRACEDIVHVMAGRRPIEACNALALFRKCE